VGFRPPGGAAFATVLATAQRLGERTVLWSVDPADWQPGVSSDQLVWRVLAAARPGAIVLLHDGAGIGRPPWPPCRPSSMDCAAWASP
jgi:peptidoglycan-N-acetylglucosamine deacetylase